MNLAELLLAPYGRNESVLSGLEMFFPPSDGNHIYAAGLLPHVSLFYCAIHWISEWTPRSAIVDVVLRVERL